VHRLARHPFLANLSASPARRCQRASRSD